MSDYKQSSLWKTAFPENASDYPEQRQRIIQAYERFRERVSHLLSHIQRELPNLTLHDITHVDALWEVASQIAGPDYPLNPAEALVLGGAFLLHDAAHCRAAYPGGLDEIRQLNEWRDAAARRKLDPDTLALGSEDYQAVLFDTLRVLHPKQAKELAGKKWKDKDGDKFLFPDDDLRDAYGDLIGQIAESHWFHPHQLENFGNSPITAPVCLAPANWTVDPLKIAVLLRTADACHLDAKRAPRFLMLLNQPSGISAVHWQFQSKIHQLKCDVEREELLITGSPFGPNEQAAWWQAYDAASLADRELNAADSLLRDFRLQRLAAREIAGVRSPVRFAKHVPTKGWFPVDTSLRISNIQSVVERFGGEKLYGDKPWLALRELIQNARDAIHAARSLKYLNEDEGEIEVAIEDVEGGHWLHVTDNGIGMSRYVLTEVLLDFGHSLWRSTDLSGEWSGLASSGFEAIGQFGIGFFSVFMLGDQVRVCTRRCEAKEDENDRGWILEFPKGIQSRSVLRPASHQESRKKAGTRISVLLRSEKLDALYPQLVSSSKPINHLQAIIQTCAHLAPAIDIDVYASENSHRVRAVRANDWIELPDTELLSRIRPKNFRREEAKKYWDSSRQLSEFFSSTGLLLGRCALPLYPNNLALGVTGGILSGYIDDLSGVVLTHPQRDLARQTAIPVITKLELQIWANCQAEIIANLGNLSTEDSAQLASYGAGYEKLTIGKMDGKNLPFGELVTYLATCSKLVVSEEEFTHDDEDPCDSDHFDLFFSPVEKIFHLDDPIIGTPDWIENLLGSQAESNHGTMTPALIAAVNIAWGNSWEKDTQTIQVGTVGTAPILRKCVVYKRTN